MKCEECQLELEDLLYDEVSPRAAAARAHLNECEACQLWQREVERENEIFARYHAETALEPRPEMWVAIRDRLREEGTSLGSVAPAVETPQRSRFDGLFGWLRRPAFVRQALGAAALIALTALVTTWVISRSQVGSVEVAGVPRPNSTPQPSPTTELVIVPAPTPAGDSRSNAPRELVALPKRERVATPLQTPRSDEELLRNQLAKTERTYVDTIRMLNQAIARRKGSIDPEVYSQYEASLALIDESIDKSRTALRGRMSDPVAGQFLLAAYARKVELMQEIAIQ